MDMLLPLGFGLFVGALGMWCHMKNKMDEMQRQFNMDKEVMRYRAQRRKTPAPPPPLREPFNVRKP